MATEGEGGRRLEKDGGGGSRLPHPAPWRRACGAYLAKWHIFRQQHFISSPPPSSQSFHPDERLQRQRGGGGGGSVELCWHRLMRKRRRERERGGETQRDMHKDGGKKLWRIYSSCGSSFPLKSGKSWCTGTLLRSHDHQATLLRSLWRLAASKTFEQRIFLPASFFQTRCISSTWVSWPACQMHFPH